MSTQCRHFVQNAWKKELCSNCFKPREEHASPQPTQDRPIVSRTANSVKRVAHKVQGILRFKEPTAQVRSKRKNVAFPDSLTEIIGWDGGDDLEDEPGGDEPPDDPDNGSLVDDLPDSEEERALGNLTRANTNFNTVTANLSVEKVTAEKSPAKGFGLMLGRAPKASDGKKIPLVSVKPFGGDDSVPTARRPNDKKAAEPPKSKSVVENSGSSDAKSELPKTARKPIEERKPETTSTKTMTSSNLSSSLGKIVDMPLITSTSLVMSVMRDDSAQNSIDSHKSLTSLEQKRVTNIARTPAIKKTENEKPRLAPNPDQNLEKNNKNLEMSNGIELNLSPIRTVDIPGKSNFVKDTSRFKGSDLADLAERKVEGEASAPSYPYEQSRESAGEPDGKADEEVVAEPPALPKSPPPIEVYGRQQQEPRTSFLHTAEKPKPTVPLKPTSLPSAKASLATLLSENRAYEFRISQRNSLLAHSVSETQLCATEEKPKLEAVCPKSNEKLEQQEDEHELEEEQEDSESSSTEQPRKRQAPRPPDECGLFARKPAPGAKSDCPVVREKEKRERASSCSPKFRKGVCESPDPRPPEPAPRRNISLSQDSLANAACIVEEKKKARSKFSLKKFLRMGSRKDVDMTGGSSDSRSGEIPCTPQPKPRLEIIHPLELDGAAVQVVRNDKSSCESATDSKIDNQTSSPTTAQGAQHVTTRPSKPPPPPRTQSLEESSRAGSRLSPAKQQQQQVNNGKPQAGKSWQPNGGSSASDSIYANLGAAAAQDVAGAMRSALAPAKPRRTSSMRDQANNPASGPAASQLTASAAVAAPTHWSAANDSLTSNESQVSERLSMSSEGDTSLELRHGSGGNYPVTKRQSDSGALVANSKQLKFQQALFTRSTSLPYCAGESDSEMYSPFGYTSESCDDSQDEGTGMSRLRHRRGRSIVHLSLEDNYGAVIVANHEALAQFLEQANQTAPLAPGLRALKSVKNLQFRNFSVEHSSAVVTGRRVFFSATWNEHKVTVCVAFEPIMPSNEFHLMPVVEFVDSVPKDVADLVGAKNREATISVLPRLQMDTLKSFAVSVWSSGEVEATVRETSFVLLQLVSAFKSLQARGIENSPVDLSNVVLAREDTDVYHKLYLFQGLNMDSEKKEEEQASLCRCALIALEELNLAEKLPLVRELLVREKAVTLSQVKSMLEFALWGPADASLGCAREREAALQRWLDLERATVLRALVRPTRTSLSLADQYQLLFLVRTSARIMCEASLLIDRQRDVLTV